MRHTFSHTLLYRRVALFAAFALISPQFATAQLGSVLYSEDFESLAGSLGPSVNERTGLSKVTAVASDPASVPIPNAFTHTPPAGWTIDNNFTAYGAAVGAGGVPLLGDPDFGVDEWEGWSIARKEFWIFAEDQTRSQFTNASGNVAVADGDEWDDLNVNGIPRPGYMNTNLVTGDINVAGHQGQTLKLSFDSSWRPEAFDDSHVDPLLSNKNNQSAVVAASFDGGAETFLTFWDSDSGGGFYKGDAQNEALAFDLAVPPGATNVQLKFGYYNAANDWWWAIDNLALTDAGLNTVWSENFDAVPLQDSVNERGAPGGKVTTVATTPNTDPVPNAFTHTGPAGWSIDNSLGLPGIGNPDVGVEEWEGWSFTNSQFWLFVKDSNRSQFTDPATGKASGIFAVADPDNWDNLGDAESLGTFNSLLVTPELDISGVAEGELAIEFSSSWRDEDTQKAILEVDYGSGWVNVFTWSSDSADPDFKDDAPNETVFSLLNNPAGATTARVRFGLLDSTDDWWWAIDNVRIGSTGVVPEPSALFLSMVGMFALASLHARRRENGAIE